MTNDIEKGMQLDRFDQYFPRFVEGSREENQHDDELTPTLSNANEKALDTIQVKLVEEAIEEAIEKTLKLWNEIEPYEEVDALKLLERSEDSRRLNRYVWATAKEEQQQALTKETSISAHVKSKTTKPAQGVSYIKRVRIQRVGHVIKKHMIKYDEAVLARKSDAGKLSSLLYKAERCSAITRQEYWRPTIRSGSASSQTRAMGKNEMIFHFELHHRNLGTSLQKYKVLGSQTLAEIADHFYCIQNQTLESYGRKSSFFFIGNKFYVDMRHPTNIDYTKNIRQWIAEDPESIEKYGNHSEHEEPMKMEETCFRALRIRLGEPYLYCHQGDCEHIFIFKQVTLVHPSDEQNVLAYPIVMRPRLLRGHKCYVCETYHAKYVCYGDPLSVKDPMIFCDHCYFSAHYSQQGALKFSNFKSYPYYGKA